MKQDELKLHEINSYSKAKYLWEQKILKALTLHPREALQVKDISALTGLPYQKITPRLNHLAKKGKIKIVSPIGQLRFYEIV